MKITGESFKADVAGHQMTIVKEDGLYRHLRFSRTNTSNMSFNIVTWPGYLAYVGDMGDYVFARIPDMFEFFRGKSINKSYWAEKVQAECRDGVKEYSPEVARAWVEQQLKDYEASDDVRAEAADLDYDNGECRLYDQLEAIDFNGLSDHWEANFKEYTDRYVWCCFAIVWAIQQYDAAQKPAIQQQAALS